MAVELVSSRRMLDVLMHKSKKELTFLQRFETQVSL